MNDNDIADDPEIGPLWKQLEEMELPSAFDDAQAEAPAEELVGDKVISTAGRSNARAAVIVSSRPPKPKTPKSETAEPSDATDEPAAVPLVKPNRGWLLLVLLAAVVSVAWAAAAYLREPARNPAPPDGEPTTSGTVPPSDTAATVDEPDHEPTAEPSATATPTSTAVASSPASASVRPVSSQAAPTASAVVSAEPVVSAKPVPKPVPQPQPQIAPVFP